MADCFPDSAAVTRCAVHGGLELAGQFGIGGGGQRRTVGHQHAGGHLVVLGLADQVGRDVHRVGGVVGQDRDLGGSGLGVDSDLRTADALGGGDVDVARPGDHVHRREFGAVGVGAAVGQQRHGLRPADRPHLVDPEQCRGGQDGRVRQAMKGTLHGGLRRAGDHQRVHAGDLGRHHVHHHAGRIDRVAAGHVEAHPLDGHPAFGDGGARRPVRWWYRCGAGRRARPGCARSPPRGRSAPRGRGRTARACRAAAGTRTVSGRTPSNDSPYSRAATAPRVGDRVDDRAHLGHHGVDVDAAPRQGGTQLRRGQGATAQVDSGHLEASHRFNCP